MQPFHHKLAGYLLIAAAGTFWLSWFLMPDQGTADPDHILAIVRQHRTSVYWSVLVQIISSVLFIPAILLLLQGLDNQKNSRLVLLGAGVFLIGVMGMCADAFFHLMAYFMVQDGLLPSAEIQILMASLQSEGIVFLLPLMLPFFIGAILLALGLHRQNRLSSLPAFVFIGSLLLAILLGIGANLLGLNKQPIVLTFLAAYAIGLSLIGMEYLLPKKAFVH
jgi:hypothetical protein